MRTGKIFTGGSTLLSTAATGTTNIVVPLAIQVSGDLSTLGGYAVVAIPATVALAISRSVASQTVLRGFGISETPGLAGWLFGLASAGCGVTALLILILELPNFFYLVALALPVALLQDMLRYRCFGARLPFQAAFSDLMWLATLLAVVLVYWLMSPTPLGPGIVLFANLVGAGVGLLTVFLLRPRISDVFNSMVRLRGLVIESLAIFGFAQISQVAAAFFLSLETLGLARSAFMVLTPLSLLFSTCLALVVPRIDVTSVRAIASAARIVSGGLLGAGFAGTAVFLLLPEGVLTSLNFPLESSALTACLILLTLGVSASGYVSIHLLHLRAVAETRSWLRPRLLAACAEPGVTLSLAMLLGAPGLSSNALTTNAAFMLFSRGVRHGSARGAA